MSFLANMYLIILGILTLILFLITFRLKKYEAINKLPGPNWMELFQFFILKKSSKDIYKYMSSLPERYGPVVKIWLKPFEPSLIVSDPKYFEVILTSQEYLRKTRLYDLLHGIAGNGLGNMQDATQWKSERKFFNPIFNHTSISNYTLRLRHHLDNLKTALISNENKPIDIHITIHHCAMFMIMEYLIEERFDEEIATKIIKGADKSLEMTMERAFSSIKSNDFIFRFTKMYKTWTEVHKNVDQVFEDLIQRQCQMRKNRTDVEKKNLMDMLFEKNYSQFELLSHLKTFVIAGFDTIAATTSFALFEIAKREDIQEKILNEYLSIAGNDEDYTITFDDLQNMTYTESVIKETLRMYPGIPHIERRLKSPAVIDGFTIPQDMNIIFSIPSLHKFNFPNPEIFDPDRFSPENGTKISPYIYAPFSIGPRNCIGRRLAMVEMKSMIFYVVKNFTLHPVQPEHKLDISGDFGLKSKNGIPVIFKQRI